MYWCSSCSTLKKLFVFFVVLLVWNNTLLCPCRENSQALNNLVILFQKDCHHQMLFLRRMIHHKFVEHQAPRIMIIWIGKLLIWATYSWMVVSLCKPAAVFNKMMIQVAFRELCLHCQLFNIWEYSIKSRSPYYSIYLFLSSLLHDTSFQMPCFLWLTGF